MAWDSAFGLVNGRVEAVIEALRHLVAGHSAISSSDDTLSIGTQAASPSPTSPASPRTGLSSRKDEAATTTSKHTPKVQVSRRKTGMPLALMNLPAELQVLVIRNLDFGDMQRLRQTCHFYRSFISKNLVKDIFGKELKPILLSHCSRCLKWDRTRGRLLCAELQDPNYPFCSTCFDCAVQNNELDVSKRVTLGDYRSAWVCKWCGYPTVSSTPSSQPHFHPACYTRYYSALIVYMVLGWTQFCITIVGSALCFRYFKGDKRVLGSCIAGIIVAAWPLILIDLRNPAARRTYHWTFLLELILLGLWALPTYAIAQTIQPGTKPPRTTVVTLSFCGINLLFRLLNCLGNLVLLCEYKLWRQNKPKVNPAKRVWNWIMAGLIYWTFPRAVEQSYPPRW